jgi:hypothetical protein
MSKTTLSVRSYGTEYIDNVGVTETTPFDIVAAMEKRFREGPMMTPITPLDTPLAARATKSLLRASLADLAYKSPVNEEMMQIRASRYLRKMLRRNFERPDWLPDDEKALLDSAGIGLECTEDILSDAFRLVDKVKSRQKWKAEQEDAQNPEHYSNTEDMVFGLPPRTTGKSHEPAYYKLAGKKTIIDMSQPDGKLKPKLATNAPMGLNLIARRLNIDFYAGDTELLNYILKQDKVTYVDDKGVESLQWKWLPAYASRKIDGVWHVEVGWQLNRKVFPGEFHRVTPDDEAITPWVVGPFDDLERFNPKVHDPDDILTASQLDYHLLSEGSDLPIVDEHEEVVTYMNPDEELVTQGMIRDDDHEDEDIESWLLVEAAVRMDRFIDLMQGSAVWEDSDFIPTIHQIHDEMLEEVASLEHRAAWMDDKLSKVVAKHFDCMNDNVKKRLSKIATTVASLQGQAKSLEQNFQTEIEGLQSQMEQVKEVRPVKMGYLPTPPSTRPDACPHHHWTDTAKSVGFDIKYDIAPTIVPAAHLRPPNDIEQPKVVSHDLRPWPQRTFQMTLEQSKQLRRQKQVCAAIIHGRFGMLVREKNASDAFAAALEAALA